MAYLECRAAIVAYLSTQPAPTRAGCVEALRRTYNFNPLFVCEVLNAMGVEVAQ